MVLARTDKVIGRVRVFCGARVRNWHISDMPDFRVEFAFGAKAEFDFEPAKGQLLAASSTDRCNTFCKLLSRRLIEQGLSRPFVELPCDGTELGLAVQGQISAARKILAQQSVGVFV